MKWIAVDYGERRTGLAVCDASELIVTPVTPQIEEKSLNKVADAAAAARLAQGAEGVGADRKARLDSVSAAVILESFLAWRKAHPGEEPPEVAAPTAPEQA